MDMSGPGPKTVSFLLACCPTSWPRGRGHHWWLPSQGSSCSLLPGGGETAGPWRGGSIEQKQVVSRHGYLAFAPNSRQGENSTDVRLTKEAAAWTGPPFPACWSSARKRPMLGWPKMA